jgi:hypothetical protein
VGLFFFLCLMEKRIGMRQVGNSIFVFVFFCSDAICVTKLGSLPKGWKVRSFELVVKLNFVGTNQSP